MPTTSKNNPNQETDLATPSEILEMLRMIKDPEVGLNIVDLGLVYKVEYQDRVAHVYYSVTSPMCPMSHILYEAIKAAVIPMKGIEDCVPHLVFDPPWNPNMISEKGRLELYYPY